MFFPGAPDLVVEVISPNDRYSDVMAKIIEWLDAGVRMVVVVNPYNRRTEVYNSLKDIVVLMDTDMLDGGDVVPGWRMRVSEIFE